MTSKTPSKIPLPKGWPTHVKSGVIHAISLAHFSITHARSWLTRNDGSANRMAENERLRQEVVLLKEELRIKDARMSAIEAQKRPRNRSIDTPISSDTSYGA